MYIYTAMLTLSLLFMSSQAVNAVSYSSWTPYGYKVWEISETQSSHRESMISMHPDGVSSSTWWRMFSDHPQKIQQGDAEFSTTDYPNGSRMITGYTYFNVITPLYQIQTSESLEINMTLFGSFSFIYRLNLIGNHQTPKNSFRGDEQLEISMQFNPLHSWSISGYHHLNLTGFTQASTEERHFQGKENEQWSMEGYPYHYFLASGHHQLTFSGEMKTQKEQRTLQGTQFMGLSILFDLAGLAMISGSSSLQSEMKSPQQQHFLQESLSESMTFNANHVATQSDLKLEGWIKTQEEQRRLTGDESQGLSVYLLPWGERWMEGHNHLDLLGQVNNSIRQQTLAGQDHEDWSTRSSPLTPPLFLASRENRITLW